MRAVSLANFSTPTTLSGWASRLLKRLLDIVLSAMALLFLAPVFGLIAIAIKRDSPGPLFYGGHRIGRAGKVFKIWKFRTMYEDPKSYQGPRVTAQDDPRITPIGHWLRNTKLNELPQFWNVLVGEMSLVGPRPEDPIFANTWPQDVWKELLSVRPGITSPASVQYRNEEKLLMQGTATKKYIQDLVPDKIRLDQIYVRHHGLWLDLDTLFWTFLLLLPKISAYTPPESLLFVGPATRLARRYLNWFTIDALTTLAALAISGIMWRFYGPLNLGWPRSIAVGLLFAMLYSLIGALLGVNQIAWSKANFSDALDLLPAWFLASVIAFGFNSTARILPDALIITASLLGLVGFVFTRYRSRLLTVIFAWISRALPGIHMAGERVIIVGSGAAAQHAAWLLEHPDIANLFWVAGFVDNDIFKLGTRIYGSTVLGTCKDIPELIQKLDIGLVVVTDHHHIGDGYRVISQACRNANVRFVVLPNLLGIFSSVGTLPLVIPVTASDTDSIDLTDTADRKDPEAACESKSRDGLGQDEDNPCLHCLARYTEAQASIAAPENKN